MSKAFIRTYRPFKDDDDESLRNITGLCVYCLQVDRTTPATVVDHIIPHRGDKKLFWDQSNWQPLCKHCHDSIKAREEARGYAVGCGVDGMPVDPKHSWWEKGN